MKRIAKISGVGYLIIFISGLYANFIALEPLINNDTPSIVIQSILSNSQQLLYAIISFLIMLIFDLLLVLSLFVFFRKVNTSLHFLMVAFRLLNAVVFSIALFKLIEVYYIINNVESIPSLEQQSKIIYALIHFETIWLIGLLFFSTHLLFLGGLILKSKHVPDVIGVLILLASLGYAVDSIAALSMENYTAYQNVFAVIVIMPAIIGELSFTIWLLLYGFNVIKTKS